MELEIYVRHNLTDYDQILKETRSREEARRRVKNDVQDILRAWARTAPNAGASQATSAVTEYGDAAG